MTLTRTDRPHSRSPSSPVEMSARPPSHPPEASDARARVRQLRADAELASERTTKAALLYEAGYVNEVLLQQPAQAVQD
jgi:hypothetical protein